jgi:adenosylcobinamide kinase / adenosylcobinamide-phosphate guanylyltransferase
LSTQSAAGGKLLTLVLGGARSGKSRHAQELAMTGPPPWTYVATAQALDAEMEERIAAHQTARGEGWQTVEAPVALAQALRDMPLDSVAVVDCLTLWLSNLMLENHNVQAASAELEAALELREAPTILVSNEVGLGIVPETPLGRAFRDEAGTLNQRLAAKAGRVLFMMAGLAISLKEPT